MANESAAGRDGYILAYGRRIYHVYKQSFPMEFWYGLTPDANREDSPGLIDVRTLPAKYLNRPIETDWLKVKKRSFAKAARDQEVAHAEAFANALGDGYDLADHVRREEERAHAEWEAARMKRDEAWSKGECECCGLPLSACPVPF